MQMARQRGSRDLRWSTNPYYSYSGIFVCIGALAELVGQRSITPSPLDTVESM